MEDLQVAEAFSVPRIGVTITKAELHLILLAVVQKMGYDRPTEDQKTAVEAFVLGKDVFVTLPTSSRKSLCYACLPHVFDRIRRRDLEIERAPHHSIAVVVSPLNSLMQDQVSAFTQGSVR